MVLIFVHAVMNDLFLRCACCRFIDSVSRHWFTSILVAIVPTFFESALLINLKQELIYICLINQLSTFIIESIIYIIIGDIIMHLYLIYIQRKSSQKISFIKIGILLSCYLEIECPYLYLSSHLFSSSIVIQVRLRNVRTNWRFIWFPNILYRPNLFLRHYPR